MRRDAARSYANRDSRYNTTQASRVHKCTRYSMSMFPSLTSIASLVQLRRANSRASSLPRAFVSMLMRSGHSRYGFRQTYM